MYGLGWEFHQQQQIGQAQESAQRAARKATDIKAEVKALRAAVDRLLLINRALWEIIAADKGLSDEYLTKKVNEIDSRDGRLDGKMTTAVRECPACGKTLFKGHFKCLYCGAPVTDTDPFSAIDTEPPSDGLYRQGMI